MKSHLKQLIPGNPGTSFVVALLYAIKQKYGETVANKDQLRLFANGIVNSHTVFFSGVLNEIAKEFGIHVHVFSNSKVILQKAKPELQEQLVSTMYSLLNQSDFEKLLEQYHYLVFSVDMYQFRNYHDYHFVCIYKEAQTYNVFEPKSGSLVTMRQEKLYSLISSITAQLKDVLLCFCI